VFLWRTNCVWKSFHMKVKICSSLKPSHSAKVRLPQTVITMSNRDNCIIYSWKYYESGGNYTNNNILRHHLSIEQLTIEQNFEGLFSENLRNSLLNTRRKRTEYLLVHGSFIKIWFNKIFELFYSILIINIINFFSERALTSATADVEKIAPRKKELRLFPTSSFSFLS